MGGFFWSFLYFSASKFFKLYHLLPTHSSVCRGRTGAPPLLEARPLGQVWIDDWLAWLSVTASRLRATSHDAAHHGGGSAAAGTRGSAELLPLLLLRGGGGDVAGRREGWC
jgi:hypothetical protein